MLVDGQGQRIDKGPTEHRQRSETARPGRDQRRLVHVVPLYGRDSQDRRNRQLVRANPKAFDNADDILALYREPEELNAVLEEDAKRFAAAMEQIGITSLSRSGEPVSTMASRFEQELDLQMVACEFGLLPAEFTKRLKASEAMAPASARCSFLAAR